MQIFLSADYETPKDLVSRLPLLTEVDEDDLDDDLDDDGDESTVAGGSSGSPNMSLLTGVTSLASIDGAVRRSQMRAGMRGRRGRSAAREGQEAIQSNRTLLGPFFPIELGMELQ